MRTRIRVGAIVAAVCVAAAAVGVVTVQLLRSVPAITLTASPVRLRALPGRPPRPRWPSQAQAAVGVVGAGMLAQHGGDQPMPIASVAKIMTGFIVLRDHPLPPGRSGPAITVTPADAAAYAAESRQGQSVVKVAAGERLSERQALEAMLIPSGNNIAAMLARWDAGSTAAFVAKMNAQARALSLRGTRYTDASGYDATTVSTASDQLRLAMRALQIPAFQQIVAMPQVDLPVAGLAYNVNGALGHDGIDGVKTGSTPSAGGCLVFSARRTVAGRQVTIVGAVLGVQATSAQPSELAGVISASENLLTSVDGALVHVDLVRPGAVLGTLHSVWASGPPVLAASGLSVTGWPGTSVTVSIAPPRLAYSVHQGQPVAWATVTVGGEVARIRLKAGAAVAPPSLSWRLSRR